MQMIAGVLRDCDGFRITRTGADRIGRLGDTGDRPRREDCVKDS
jgi:hypothetical protein